MDDITFSQACVEVLEVLKYMKKDDVQKLPKIKIELYEKNKDNSYKFKYNKDLKYEEQKISKKAKAILANLYIDYWATDSEKIKIKNIEMKQINEAEKNKKEKYDNYFDKEVEHKKEETSIIKYEKISLWRKIKNFFQKKN